MAPLVSATRRPFFQLALRLISQRIPEGVATACSHERGGRGGVDEDEVFAEFFDVGLDLVHFSLKHLLAALLANSVELAVVRLLLVVNHQLLPLLLQSCDELQTLLLGHEHALTIFLRLFLDLHLTNKGVLVIDLLFDLGDVLGDLAVILLLKEVLVLACRQFRS